MPVQPLRAIPLGSPGQRPGLITLIGIASIVVAVLSLTTAIGWILWAVVLYTRSQVMTALMTPPAAPIAVVESPATLNPEQRKTIIEGFMRLQVIDDNRANLLDALLAEHGLTILPLAANDVSAEGIARVISDHGTMPSAAGARQPQYFIVGNGRIEIYDTHALFRPGDGGDAVRVTEDDIVAQQLPSGLRPADVKAAMARINQIIANGITPQQDQAIRNLLASPNQTLLTRTSGGVESQIYAAWSDASGQLTLVTARSTLTLRADGSLLSTGPRPLGSNRAIARVSGGLLAGIALIGILNLMLAVLLLIAGTMTLRQSFKARTLHMIYAILKLLLSVIGTLALLRLWRQFAGPNADPGTTLVLVLLWSCALVHPLVLLVLLNLRSVRGYFAR